LVPSSRVEALLARQPRRRDRSAPKTATSPAALT
jgi:hypothetical protein